VLPAMAAHVVFNLVTVIQGSHRQESDQIVLNRWVQRIIHARHATTAGK
jgi:hypothetical protein